MINKILLSLFLVVGTFGNAFAVDPIIFFTDITSGPLTGNNGLSTGAIVTLWGANLGDTQGSSVVQVGGVTSVVHCWGRADGQYVLGLQPAGSCGGYAKTYNSYQKYQAISFSIPATAPNGATTISVTVNGVVSNTLPFTTGVGRICFVSGSGNDATGACGSGAFATPFRNAQYITSCGRVGPYCPTPGDIYYFMNGTDIDVTAGAAWILYPSVGSLPPALPIFFTVYPNHGVTMNCGTFNNSGSGCAVVGAWNAAPLSVNTYFAKFKWIATGGNGAGSKSRYIAIEATGQPSLQTVCPDNVQAGVFGGTPDGDGMRGLGNYIHDSGCATSSKLGHVFYFSSARQGPPAIEANEIGWNYVTDSGQWGALHTYDEHNCAGFTGNFLYHDNAIKNQRGEGIGFGLACDTGADFGSDIYAWNNLFVNVGYDSPVFSGLNGGHYNLMSFSGPNFSTTTIYIFNNSSYNYGDTTYQLSPTGYLISLEANALGCFNGNVEFKNNLSVDTNGFNFWQSQCSGKSPSVHDHDLWYSTVGNSGTPTWDQGSTGTINTNPLLVSPVYGNAVTPVVGGDFSIQQSSPANGTGGTIAYGISHPTINTDINGIPRTIRSIGAYEYALGGGGGCQSNCGGGSSPPSFRLPIARVAHARVAR